jgi:hypothetical protein
MTETRRWKVPRLYALGDGGWDDAAKKKAKHAELSAAGIVPRETA